MLGVFPPASLCASVSAPATLRLTLARLGARLVWLSFHPPALGRLGRGVMVATLECVAKRSLPARLEAEMEGAREDEPLGVGGGSSSEGVEIGGRSFEATEEYSSQSSVRAAPC